MADCKHRQPEDGCGMCRDKREIARLTEQRDALLAACEAAEERLEQLKDGADDGDRESICGTLGILASARLRARGGDR